MTTENPNPEMESPIAADDPRQPVLTEAQFEEQLESWVNDKPEHLGAVDGNKSFGQCCPDFSCCEPKILWPKERREFFRDHPKARMEMMFGALSGAVSLLGKDQNIYLTGDS